MPPFSLVAGEQHHLGFFFRVELTEGRALLEQPDGQDAGGALWVDLARLGEHPLSPLVLHALRL